MGAWNCSPNTEIFFSLINLGKIKVYVEWAYYDFNLIFIIWQTFCAPELTHASVRQKEKSKKEHEAAAEFRKLEVFS